MLLSGEDSSVLSIDSFNTTYEGSYVCEVTSSIVTGLTISSEPILLVDSAIVTGLESYNVSKIEIYPMPFHDHAVIEVTGKVNTPFDIFIYDETGRLVRQDKNIISTKLNLIRGELNVGNYFMEIINGTKKIKARFLIN